MSSMHELFDGSVIAQEATLEPKAEWYEMLAWLRQQAHPLAALAADQVARVELLREGLLERDSEVHALRETATKQAEMLAALGALLRVAGRAARMEATAHEVIEAATDKTPFRNLMATMYGLDAVGAPLPPKRRRKTAAA